MKTKQTQKNRIPKLRFPGFSDVWEEKKLGDVGENIIGLTYSPSNVVPKGGTLVLRSSNIKNECLDITNQIRVNIDISEKLKIKNNDILICTRNGSQRLIGKNILLKKSNEPLTFGAFMSVYRSFTNDFVVYLFKTDKYKKQIHQNLGARINQITTGYLNKFKFYFPKKEEQEKIAGFLGVVDERIGILQKKREALVKYKKGIMQKLFSQEIRFKDENNKDFPEWEEKRLGEIGKIATSSVDKKIAKSEKEISLLNYMDVYKRNHIFHNDVFQKVTARDSQIISSNLKQGDVLFTPSSETPIDIGHSAVVMEDLNNVLFSYHLVRFRPKKDILDHNFSAFAFKSFNFYKELWRKVQGATRFTLSKKALEESKINIPKSLKEQQKIGSFLLNLDDKIENINKKITLTQKFKKGLLQGLFV